MSAKKKSTKKKPAKRSAPRKGLRVLSAAERGRVLRAPENYEEVTKLVIAALKRVGKRVRAPVGAAKIASLLKHASRAQERETKVEQAFFARLRPLADARLVADGEAWRAVLDAWAAVQVAARRDETLLQEFSFLREALARPRAAKPEEPPAP